MATEEQPGGAAEARPRSRKRLVTVLVAVVLVAAGIGAAAYLLSAPSPSPTGSSPVASFTVARDRMHVDVDASATTDPDGDVTGYEWDFEDDGTVDASGVTAAFDYPASGAYRIRLRVTDALGHVVNASRTVSVAPSTLDFEFWDFFNVPFGEWWDYRSAVYGEAPVGAECFTSAGIANGICTPSQAAVPDVPAYPYTHWWDMPETRSWSNPANAPIINAPYRMRATGVDVPGYTLGWPVFLPVLNSSAIPGQRLDFDWRMQFLDTATTDALEASGCPISRFALDGYHIRSEIELVMDLQASRRAFGVEAGDAAAAQGWWAANVNPACGGLGPAERALQDWFLDMGGSPRAVGKYDIYNAYEWFWDPVYTAMQVTVDPDGTTTVTIDNVAWGTGNLLSRMFYWGNASYADHHLDSREARGWWGMEPLGWFEDFAFTGSLGAEGFDFALSTVIQYHFRHVALPGPDGSLDRSGDVPAWTWGPVLQDYLDDFTPDHLLSELDRYPGMTEPQSTPGGSTYGQEVRLDYAPVRWDLAAGQTWHFDFPTADVVFFDPNLTPLPANPASGDHVRISAPLALMGTEPEGYGEWSDASVTWDVYGPAMTGGPEGHPGADGTPGTSDDDYALEPWPDLVLVPRAPSPAPAGPGPPKERALGALAPGTLPGDLSTVVARVTEARPSLTAHPA